MTEPTQISDQSIVELESKVSHLEFSVENLRQAALDQATTIHKLEKLIKELKDRFEGMAGEGQDIGPANEKPPHY